MSLLRRTTNLASFLTWPRMKAALGLLSSETRHSWIQTIDAPKLSLTPLATIYPWFSFPSIDYIAAHISSNMQVLEFGCGYSTIWWGQRVAHITSIERSSHWVEEVRQALSKHAVTNVELIPFRGFNGTTEEEIQAGSDPDSLAPIIQSYVSTGQSTHNTYDIVVVDDVFRNQAAEAGVALVKPGGMLVLDDSERERYRPTFERLNRMGWSFASFYGPTPYHFHEKQTTIWHKPLQV